MLLPNNPELRTPNSEPRRTVAHRYDLLRMSKLQGQIRALSKFV
jgi:hypothetical protein